MRPCLFVCIAIGVAGCGPSTTEMRMIAAPPKPANCELEFLSLSINQVSPAAPEYEYEVLGHVMLHETGEQDPAQEKYREIVRPRACAMGGEGVAILAQATSSHMFASGSAVDYAVVRKKPAPGAAHTVTGF